MRRIAATLLATLTALPVFADQLLYECGYHSSAEYISEPWYENTATFANGEVRLAVLDHVEPVSEARALLILSPPYGETGERQCRVLKGFSGLSLEGMTATYDASVGLQITLTAQVYLEDTAEFASAQVDITLNQSTGDINHYVTPYFE